MTDDPYTATDRQERPLEHRQDIVDAKEPERPQGPPEASRDTPDDVPDTAIEQPSIRTIIARLRVPESTPVAAPAQVAAPAPFARSSRFRVR